MAVPPCLQATSVSLYASHLPEDGAPGGAAPAGDSFERKKPTDAVGAPSGASAAGAFLASAAAGAGETPVAALGAGAAATAGAAGEAEEEDGRVAGFERPCRICAGPPACSRASASTPSTSAAADSAAFALGSRLRATRRALLLPASAAAERTPSLPCLAASSAAAAARARPARCKLFFSASQLASLLRS